jgi:cytochrome P450
MEAPWYLAWMPLDPTKASLFADTDPHHHGNQRRKFASAYSMSSLVGYEPLVDHCTALLKTRLHEVSDTGHTINLGHWFQCYAFDVIGEVTFGQRFGFLDTGKELGHVFAAIETRTNYSTYVGVFPTLHYILFPWLPSSGGHGYVGKYTRDKIAAREKIMKSPEAKELHGPPDFVARFLQIRAENPEKMTQMDLFTICQSNIGAGSDTTAITLSAVLYYLLKHPSTYHRLQKEIDEAAKQSRISDPVTFKEAQQLVYLQAVIKEALRLHAATGLPLARVVPPAGATLAGMRFPPGSTVGINAWVAHRNTAVFGSDAHIWRPERWLEIEQEGQGADIERYFLAFGMGSRTCIGKNLSLLEISKLIPQLLRTFDFVLDNELQKTGWKTLSRWFVKPQNFCGTVRVRPQHLEER